MPTPEIGLPPDLHAFLARQDHALLTADTSDGAVLVCKAASRDIDDCRGRLPVHVAYELHATPHGPVLRLALVVHCTPPLAMETFCNIQDAGQLAEWRDLLGRPKLRVLFYDQDMRHRLSKVVSHPQDDATRALIPTAQRLLAQHDPAALDFDRAKQSVMDGTDF